MEDIGDAERRIPLWLKIGFTVWVAVWTWAYADHYGPSVFLWFCDLANFFIAAALWRESRLLFSWQAVSILAVQLAWCVDLAAGAVAGWHPFGASGYMFDPAIPLTVRLLSLFHVVHPVILIWALRRLGYDSRAWLAQTLTALGVLPVSWLFGPALNLNWTWGLFHKAQTQVAPGFWLAACMIGYPLLLYWPSHIALKAAFRKS